MAAFSRQPCSSTLVLMLGAMLDFLVARLRAKTRVAVDDRPAADGPGQTDPPLTGFRGRALTLSYSLEARAWVLRHDAQSIGLISTSRQEVSGAAGSWRLERSDSRSPIVSQPLPGTDLVASYYRRRLLRGGTIALSTGRAYVLRLHLFSGISRLTDTQGDELMRITPGRGKPTRLSIELCDVTEHESTLLLLTLAASYALLVLEAPGFAPVSG